MKNPIAIAKNNEEKRPRSPLLSRLTVVLVALFLVSFQTHAQRKKKKDPEPKWKDRVEELLKIPLEEYVAVDSIWLNPFQKFPLDQELRYVGAVQLNGWTKYIFTEWNLASDRRFTVIGKGQELIYGQVDYVLSHRMGSCGHVNVSEERYFNETGEATHKQIRQFDSDCYVI
ncbi:MAG: hypothetical protein AAF193_07665, partial [Bacteroidota bacterium]